MDGFVKDGFDRFEVSQVAMYNFDSRAECLDSVVGGEIGAISLYETY